MDSCSTSHSSERQQIPMSPSCHSQVMKGLWYDVTVQNTSALHYKHNLWAKGKQEWEFGCSYAVWVWYATAKISLILQAGLIKETKHSYWLQKRKMTQKQYSWAHWDLGPEAHKRSQPWLHTAVRSHAEHSFAKSVLQSVDVPEASLRIKHGKKQLIWLSFQCEFLSWGAALI